MHFTPIRASIFGFPLAIALASGGCGQVTGLSDDYQYDLEGGAASADSGAATDGATKADAPATTEGGTEGGIKCSTSQAVKAGQKLNTLSGSPICKSCLATSCCNDVDTCTSNADCDRVLACKLDCTQKSGDKTSCFKSCTVNGGPSPVYQATVGACGPAECSKECGLN